MSNSILSRIFLYGFLLIATVGFARPIQEIDPAFVDYRRDFIALVKRDCKRFHVSLQDVIVFDDLDKQILGICAHSWLGSQVKIDRTRWNKANVKDQRQLIYHELSHCYLNKRHSDYPGHYMFAYFVPVPPEDLETQVRENSRSFCGE